MIKGSNIGSEFDAVKGKKTMRRFRPIFYISVILLLGSFNSPLTIVFYGDSLTAGYGLDPEQAFPALIEQELKAQGHDIQVINAGLSGETSAGGVTRINWVLRQPVDIFVLELGANDGLRGLKLDQTKENLQTIIDRVKAKFPKAQIIVAGMMVPPNLGEDYTSEFSKMYPEIAKSNDAKLIPFLLQDVAGEENLNLPDGIHPNAEGHKIVARNVLRVLSDMF